MAKLILNPRGKLSQEDIQQIAKGQIPHLLAKAHFAQLNTLLHIGRKRNSDVPLFGTERDQLKDLMQALVLDGIVRINAQVLKDDRTSVLIGEAICIELFKRVDAP